MALNVADIDTYTETVRVFGKGKKERLCPVGSKALEAVQRYRLKAGVHDGALFLSKLRKRLSIQGVDDVVNKYWRASGLPVRLVHVMEESAQGGETVLGEALASQAGAAAGRLASSLMRPSKSANSSRARLSALSRR